MIDSLNLLNGLTALIALIALGIAYGQWHTARTKLVLDLFDKRMGVYDELVEALGPVWMHGNAEVNDIGAFSKPKDRARFLFGDDVNDYLVELQKTMANLGLARTMMAKQAEGDKDWPKVAYEASVKIHNFYDDFGRLGAPYMRMDAKLPLFRKRITSL